MCLAIPGQILSVSGKEGIHRSGRVRFGGIVKEVNLAYVPEAGVGDYVVVHVGFAISVLDREAAEKTLAFLAEIEALEEEDDDRASEGGPP